MEVLCATTRTGPVLLTREDALLKLLPLLGRPEAKAFIEAAKLAVSLKPQASTHIRAERVWVDYWGHAGARNSMYQVAVISWLI